MIGQDQPKWPNGPLGPGNKVYILSTPLQENYANNLNCLYFVEAAESDRVRIEVVELGTENNQACSWDYLLVTFPLTQQAGSENFE